MHVYHLIVVDLSIAVDHSYLLLLFILHCSSTSSFVVYVNRYLLLVHLIVEPKLIAHVLIHLIGFILSLY